MRDGRLQAIRYGEKFTFIKPLIMVRSKLKLAHRLHLNCIKTILHFNHEECRRFNASTVDFQRNDIGIIMFF